MTTKTQIIADISTTFLNTDEFAYSAVYTAPGGIAEAAVTLIYDDLILHGDPEQERGVVQPDTTAHGATTDISGWKELGTVLLNSLTFEVIGAPFVDLHSSGMSMVWIRLKEETRI